jgi:MFS family permease
MNLERFDWRVILSIATIAMLLQQAFSYVCQIAMPILADRIAEDFGISRAWLGFYLFLQNIAAIIGAMGCGGFILRYGALRVSQWCLILMGGSLFVISTGVLWIYPLGAILLGMAAVSTPASSHILARVCPPRLAPVVFSVKQTGVPVGSLIGGLLIPFLLSISVYVATIRTPIHLDAYGTAFVSGLIVYCVVLLLQPIRAHFDADRNPDVKLSFSGVSETMKLVISNPQLRDLSLGAFSFGGLQAIFSGFFILFMIDGLNYSEAEAGSAFAIAAVTAVGARILWGYLGSAFLSARIVLGGIGLFGGVAAILTSFYDVRWSYSMILAVAILYNVTALSWHGILLAEVARLAPPEKVGGVTGGVLAFTSVAMMIYPAFYGGLLAVTESYSIGFILCAAPSFIAGVIFLRPPIEAPWTRSVLAGLVWCLRLDRLAYGTVIAVIGALIGMFAVYARMT